MLNLLIFVRSIREGNFCICLYISSLKKVLKWYYACNYYNYAHWVTLHLYDLVNLPTTSRYLHKFGTNLAILPFKSQKKKKKNSLMGIDQAHQQNNTVIKGMNGATLVLNKDDESGLAWWKLYLHELSLIINKYESTPDVELDFEPLKHHKDSKAFQNQFSADVSTLKTSILTNPFKLNKLTMLNNEKFTFNDIVYNDTSKMSILGEEQLKAFWKNKLVTCKVPVSDPILFNSLNLPGSPNKATEKDPILILAMMEKLKKAGETQSEFVENLLYTEIFEIPQSLSANQYSLNHSTKSHVTSQFCTISKPSFHLMKSGIVIELYWFYVRKECPGLNLLKTMQDFFIMSY